MKQQNKINKTKPWKHWTVPVELTKRSNMSTIHYQIEIIVSTRLYLLSFILIKYLSNQQNSIAPTFLLWYTCSVANAKMWNVAQRFLYIYCLSRYNFDQRWQSRGEWVWYGKLWRISNVVWRHSRHTERLPRSTLMLSPFFYYTTCPSSTYSENASKEQSIIITTTTCDVSSREIHEHQCGEQFRYSLL